jgi:hypothetical protein
MNPMTRWIATALLVLPPAVVLSGCSVESRPADVSPEAERVMVGGELRYTAPRDGHIYVHDVDADRTIYSARVFRGDRIQVDPDDGDISINGREVERNQVLRGNRYQIWFDRRRD